jgi:pimeloyl-ACP methyl ester carboxylesterase
LSGGLARLVEESDKGDQLTQPYLSQYSVLYRIKYTRLKRRDVMDNERYRQAERRYWKSVGAEASETFISLSGTGTEVRVQVVGEGDPVLFLHGASNSGSTWAPLVAHLQDFSCLIVDRPGTGFSAAYAVTADDLPRFGARLLPDLLDALEIDRAHVVASSFGGHLALRSAAAAPDRIHRMVQMAAPAAVPEQVLPPFMKALKYSLVRKLVNVLPPSRLANRSIMRQMGHGASLDADRIPVAWFDWYQALGQHTDTMRLEGHMIGAEILPNLASLTLTEDLLGSVTTPTLFLWGEDDGFGGEDNARLVTGMMPNAELTMMPDSGHLPWLDDPVSTAMHTREFLGVAGPEPDSGLEESLGTEA